jgi:hypothetical protein
MPTPPPSKINHHHATHHAHSTAPAQAIRAGTLPAHTLLASGAGFWAGHDWQCTKSKPLQDSTQHGMARHGTAGHSVRLWKETSQLLTSVCLEWVVVMGFGYADSQAIQ